MNRTPAIASSHSDAGAYSPVGEHDWAAADYRLGARFVGDDVTFDDWLRRNPGDDIWRGRVAGLPPGTDFAFRCFGPTWAPDTTPR